MSPKIKFQGKTLFSFSFYRYLSGRLHNTDADEFDSDALSNDIPYDALPDSISCNTSL